MLRLWPNAHLPTALVAVFLGDISRLTIVRAGSLAAQIVVIVIYNAVFRPCARRRGIVGFTEQRCLPLLTCRRVERTAAAVRLELVTVMRVLQEKPEHLRAIMMPTSCEDTVQ